MIKDYYKILGVEATANSAEIKNAYRKLALQHHPDKNPDDKFALAQFYLIKEAYETLSTPRMRDEYLKQRWLSQVYHLKFDSSANTPEKILLKLIDANKKVQTFDAFRMDKHSIKEELFFLISSGNIALLNEFNVTDINKEVINQALQLNTVLHPKEQKLMLAELRKVNAPASSQEQINEAEKTLKQQVLLNKLTPWVIALMVLLLCIFIYSNSV